MIASIDITLAMRDSALWSKVIMHEQQDTEGTVIYATTVSS
jgi:hypothetical protein